MIPVSIGLSHPYMEHQCSANASDELHKDVRLHARSTMFHFLFAQSWGFSHRLEPSETVATKKPTSTVYQYSRVSVRLLVLALMTILKTCKKTSNIS